MTIAAYGQFTARGIAKIAAQRAKAIEAWCRAVQPEPASVAVPVAEKEQQPGIFNPAFVRRVHAKRKAEAEKAARAEQERKEAERAERWRKAVEERKRQAEEAEAAERAEALKNVPPSVRSIIALVEIEHGLPEGSITGKSRKVPVINARFEAIAKAREARPDLSLPALGRIFRRDHTTILSALRKMGLK